MINVFLTAGQLAIGRGVKVQGVTPESPLRKAVFRTRTVTQPTPIINGDTIWEIDGKPVGTPEELAAALASGTSTARVRIYRVEWMPELEVPRGQLLQGTSAGGTIRHQSVGRRSRLARHRIFQSLGNLRRSPATDRLARTRNISGTQAKAKSDRRVAILAVVGLVFALGMTVTRASWIGFAVSVVAMLLLTSSRRTILIVGACAIPLVLASVILLQQRRSIGFFDKSDQSTSWREMVWKEGFNCSSAIRDTSWSVLVSIRSRDTGVNGDCLTTVASQSATCIQICSNRTGAWLPALIVWLILIGVYIRMLWRITRRKAIDDFRAVWRSAALGGVIGFFTSGLVHYNWGDSEVVTVFYFVMGLCLVVERTNQQGDGFKRPRLKGAGNVRCRRRRMSLCENSSNTQQRKWL